MSRPPGPVISKKNWRVAPVSFVSAKRLIEQEHYAGGCGNTATRVFGLISRDGVVRGVSLWLPPMKPAADYVARVLGVESKRVLALSRLVVCANVPANGASFLLGRSLRLLRRDPCWEAAITWADTGEGHTGGIYQATNWRHTGMTTPRRLWRDDAGQLRSPRTGPHYARRNLSVAECLERGWTRTKSSAKHRFVIDLRGRKAFA